MDFHSLSEAETLQALHTTADGLSEQEVLLRRNQYGRNELSEEKRRSLWSRIREQLSDFMILILLAAALVSFLISWTEGQTDFLEPAIILGIVLLNAALGILQEAKAEHSLQALYRLTAPETTVLRDHTKQLLPAGDLVPGDLIFLSAGAKIPADARLLESYQLSVDESSLTGESHAVKKTAKLKLSTNTALAERSNLVYSGTVVLTGHATAVVTATGMQTTLGRVADMIRSDTSPDTPLKNYLSHTGKVLGIVVLLVCAVVFLLGLLQGRPWLTMFMTSVSLGVAAIPEGLPAIVTIVLSVGVQKLARKNAIIRHLPAVETLGSATVICSDKTGTLTCNKMTVTELSDGKNPLDQDSSGARALLLCAALCNNAYFEENGSGHGSATELALLEKAGSLGLLHPFPNDYYTRLAELPFDSARKCMSTVHLMAGRLTGPLPFFSPDPYSLYICKGAPEVILSKCTSRLTQNTVLPLSAPYYRSYNEYCDQCAKRALRVLAVACKPLTVSESNKAVRQEASLLAAGKDLIFLGFLCMSDPPRPEAKESISACKAAGITPVMITGDHALTAHAIATELGICEKDELPVTGQQLSELDEADLTELVGHTHVFARVAPEHKVAIVRAFQKRGEVVAMTGDGINDAPALKAADIGCAMGNSGTDVAREASDLILTDDNFSTIVAAVREGRSIYANIRHCVHFLLSCNIGEIITILFALLFGLPSPLSAIQLLWVNLITDSLPAVALGMEPPQKDTMKRKPYPAKATLFSNGLGLQIAMEGILIGALSLLAYVIGTHYFHAGSAMTFAVLSLSQLVHTIQMRSEQPLSQVGFFTNPRLLFSCLFCAFLQVSLQCHSITAELFGIHTLPPMAWLVVAILSFLPLPIVELQKHFS